MDSEYSGYSGYIQELKRVTYENRVLRFKTMLTERLSQQKETDLNSVRYSTYYRSVVHLL